MESLDYRHFTIHTNGSLARADVADGKGLALTLSPTLSLALSLVLGKCGKAYPCPYALVTLADRPKPLTP